MGARSVNAVADAGPLIHLAQIDCLQHLSLFNTLHIPDTVWEEATVYGRPTGETLSSFDNIQRITVSDSSITRFIEETGLTDLHRGESESLCLCHRNDITLLLTDDLAARDAAHHIGIQPVGSLGIIARACRQEHITIEDAERQIRMLYETSSLFVTSAIVESAVRQLRQIRKG